MARDFELFDHTADIGVRVTADTLAELLRAAGEGLYAVIGRLEAEGGRREVQLDFSADDRALLLRDYLAELLLIVDRDQRIATGVGVTVFDERRLQASVQLARVCVERSAYDREVKAITYHELEVRRTERGYEATFIVDV